MGMFDYLRCEAPLPDGRQPGELQTKDFNCEMCTHVITADGRLILEHVESVDEVPKAERPYPDAPDGTLQALVGCLRFNRRAVESKFHGIVNFYGGGFKNDWHEYNAKFTDGRLVEIVAVPGEADAGVATEEQVRNERSE